MTRRRSYSPIYLQNITGGFTLLCYYSELRCFHRPQDTTTGQDLLDVVLQHLNLLETAYFGLRFLDIDNQTVSGHKSSSCLQKYDVHAI